MQRALPSSTRPNTLFSCPTPFRSGDRDGNPFVTADSLRTALGRACEAVLGFYLDAVHTLGAELSISSEHAAIDEAVADLADASGDDAPSRADEPYRRALTGIRSEEHTSELQSLMRISYAVFCLKNKK